MMPQPTQHSLIHVLLLWITILSIIQAVFIIFFFTAGHRGLSQNSSTVTPEGTVQSQANITPSPTPDDNLLLGKGQMLTYKAQEDNDGFKWVAHNPSDSLVSQYGKDLQIKKDGYYYLILQVTLKECTCTYNGTGENKTTSECTVSVNWNKDRVLLQGWINTNTCSTGLLGMVTVLPAGGKLEFKLPKTKKIDDREHLTHLDIIYMHKP